MVQRHLSSVRTMSAPASTPAAASGSTPSTKVGRPLPGSIDLPPVKKQRTEMLAAEYDEDDDDEVEDAEEPRAIPAAVQIAHNTPSPAFFAAAATPTVNHRLTINPCHPLPPYMTRVRHAKQLVIVTSDAKHNARPYKTKGEMDVVS
jgi:hypothetical protein